jgi:hypothetical protein
MFWYVITETKSTEKIYEKSEPTNKKVYVSANQKKYAMNQYCSQELPIVHCNFAL